MRGTRIPRLHGVRNFLKKYFAIYKRLTHSRIPVQLATRCLLVVRNYFNNFLVNYTRLTHCCIHVELASHAYLGLGII